MQNRKFTKEDIERMRSIGVMKRTPRPKERIVTRTEGVDAGEKAKVTTDELGSVITESDNRQDVDIHPATYVAQLALMNG